MRVYLMMVHVAYGVHSQSCNGRMITSDKFHVVITN